MINITLEGVLGQTLGNSWILNVNSVLEIFEAIEANTNKITKFYKNLEKTMTHFVVYIDDKVMPPHLLNSKILNSGSNVKILPIIQGSEPTTMIIIGLTLIALSMILAVVLSPKQPKDVKTNSTIIGGIRNVLNRNIAIPIGYGRLRIGSAVISNDVGISNAEGTIYSNAGGGSFAGYGAGGNVQIIKKVW
jgi:hypothetical protein